MAAKSMHRGCLTWPLHAQIAELTGQPDNGEHRRMKTAVGHAFRAQATAVANVYGKGRHAEFSGVDVGAAQRRTCAVIACCWPTLFALCRFVWNATASSDGPGRFVTFQDAADVDRRQRDPGRHGAGARHAGAPDFVTICRTDPQATTGADLVALAAFAIKI